MRIHPPINESGSNANRPKSPFFSPHAIFPKLTINQPGDPDEQEADVMAERVMAMPEGDHIQRRCPECKKEEEGIQGERRLQRQAEPASEPAKDMEEEEEALDISRQAEPTSTEAPADEEEEEMEEPVMAKAEGGGMTASPVLQSQLQSSKGGGAPLPARTNRFMSQAFGRDFSHVRVHTGQQASEMNEDIQAKAFTHGADIYFRQGQYNPNSSAGKKLLAHELTHVVQQDGASEVRCARGGEPLPHREATELLERLHFEQRPMFSVVPNIDEVRARPHAPYNPLRGGRVSVTMGRFEMNGQIQIQAPRLSTLNGWDLGIFQMAENPISLKCYQGPLPVGPLGSVLPYRNWVFVDRMKAPPQRFVPDRDPEFPHHFFSSRRPGAIFPLDEVRINRGRRSFLLRIAGRDFPGIRGPGFAGAFASFRNDPRGHTNLPLRRWLKSAHFFTFIVLRNRETGWSRPLYTVHWIATGDYQIVPNPLGPFSIGQSRLHFEVVAHHPYTWADPFPVVTGPNLYEWDRTEHEQFWSATCPI